MAEENKLPRYTEEQVKADLENVLKVSLLSEYRAHRQEHPDIKIWYAKTKEQILGILQTSRESLNDLADAIESGDITPEERNTALEVVSANYQARPAAKNLYKVLMEIAAYHDLKKEIKKEEPQQLEPSVLNEMQLQLIKQGNEAEAYTKSSWEEINARKPSEMLQFIDELLGFVNDVPKLKDDALVKKVEGYRYYIEMMDELYMFIPAMQGMLDKNKETGVSDQDRNSLLASAISHKEAYKTLLGNPISSKFEEIFRAIKTLKEKPLEVEPEYVETDAQQPARVQKVVKVAKTNGNSNGK